MFLNVFDLKNTLGSEKKEVNVLKIDIRETTNKNMSPIFKRPSKITDLYKGIPILKSNPG